MRNGPYILVVAPAGYPGKRYRGRYAYEHQVVWWQNTGRCVRAGFLVHHKNDDKHDNRFVNLEEKTPSKHSKEHALPITYVALKCAYCNAEFSRPAQHVRYKIRRGDKNFYCSRTHQYESMKK